MTFNQKGAEIYIPDKLPIAEAISRTTHMAIAAHADDLEIMAIDGILQAYRQTDRWFCGIVATDGRGSPRAASTNRLSDTGMRVIRKKEQKEAARIGEYGALALLDYPSSEVKNPRDSSLREDLLTLLTTARPQIVYTHNLADKHDTHVSVTLRVIDALRRLPRKLQPKQFWGCEVWRDLDWLADDEKKVFDVSKRTKLQETLLRVYGSQIGGGKRYDLATMGRRRAHASFFQSHETDRATHVVFAMDLMPLILDFRKSPEIYVREHIRHFAKDVGDRILRLK